jgi:hypothetical protein
MMKPTHIALKERSFNVLSLHPPEQHDISRDLDTVIIILNFLNLKSFLFKPNFGERVKVP